MEEFFEEKIKLRYSVFITLAITKRRPSTITTEKKTPPPPYHILLYSSLTAAQ